MNLAALATLLVIGASPDFSREVLPLLREHCFKCHSHEAGKSKGGLVVDSAGGLSKGGDTGPATDSKNPSHGLFLRAIRRENGVDAMPPGSALPPSALATLEKWILAGAPWPESAATVGSGKPGTRSGGVTPTDRSWWAFKPLSEKTPPVKTSAGIDEQVDKALKARGWTRAPRAEHAEWLRRVSFDLTGLPPTPEEARAFVTNPDRAVAVDRLLASPHFGEKWGRFWLDLVRYAESDGYRADDYRPSTWRYRDWVVSAFNRDMPYDRFLRLQIAGDEIEPENPESKLALGYLRLGTYEYNQRDSITQWNAILEDITDVTADAALGLGMACARCHDHKYDPLLQRDYHALKSFFSGLAWIDNIPVDSETASKIAAWEKEVAGRKADLDKREAAHRKAAFNDARALFPPEIQKLLDAPRESLSPFEKQVRDLAYRQVQFEFDRIESKVKDAKEREEIKKLRLELKALTPEFDLVSTASDISAKVDDASLVRRGKSESISPAFPTVLDRLGTVPEVRPRASSSGRRAALAEWLSRPDHPLVPRVIVNRIWQRVFGRGIVATTSDWGTLGEKPSHPELLDGLTRGFIDSGWRIKPLVRLMVLSEAYGQASLRPDAAAMREADSENSLLWRGPRRRLEAEEVRDSILASSGGLDRKLGGPAVEDEKPRRSIYLKARRNTRDPLMAAFDAADGLQSTPQRLPTVTVTQTLLMRNGKLTEQQSTALGALLAKPAGTDPVAELFLRTLGRPARAEEASAVENAVAGMPRDAARWADAAHAVLESNAFLYLD